VLVRHETGVQLSYSDECLGVNTCLALTFAMVCVHTNNSSIEGLFNHSSEVTRLLTAHNHSSSSSISLTLQPAATLTVTSTASMAASISSSSSSMTVGILHHCHDVRLLLLRVTLVLLTVEGSLMGLQRLRLRLLQQRRQQQLVSKHALLCMCVVLPILSM
jgi:hypothetical protein